MSSSGRTHTGTAASVRVGFYGLAQIANAALAMVLLGILARSLGRVGFGDFSFAFVVASLGSLLADFGLGPWLTRTAAREPAAARQLMSRVLLVRLPLVLATWILVVGVMMLYPGGRERLPVILGMLAYVGGLGYAAIFESLLMSRGDVRGVSASLLVGKVLELFFVGALLVARPELGAAGAAGAMAVACLLRVAFVRGLTLKDLPGGISTAAPARAWRFGEIVSGAAPFAAGLVIWTVYSKIDVLLLERLVPADQLGLYTAAYRVLEALFLIPRSVVGVHFPIYSDAWARRQLGHQVGSGPLKLLLLGALAAAAVLIVTPVDVLHLLFGTAFTGGSGAMRILGLALVALFLNQFQSMYLGATDRQSSWLRRLSWALVVNLVANLTLIPLFGIRGAATATLLSESFLLALFIASERTDLFGGIGAAWLVRAAAAVLVLVITLIGTQAPPLVRFAVAGFAFVVTAAVLKLLDLRVLVAGAQRAGSEESSGSRIPPPGLAPSAAGMPPAAGLTVVVLTYQSDRTLAATLESVRFAGEILVIDSGSTDGTLDIARQFGARVLARSMSDGWAAQRNFGQRAASGQWILALDSDEILDEVVAAAVREIAETDPDEAEVAGASIRMLNYFLGRPMRHGGLDRDDHVRLVKRGAGRWEGPVHEKLVVSGPVRHLPGLVHHMTGLSFDQRLAKIGTYAAKRAETWRAEGRRPSTLRAVWEPVRFLAGRVLIRGGWRDGLPGIVWWWLQATELLGAHLLLTTRPLYREEAAPKISAASDPSREPETHVRT